MPAKTHILFLFSPAIQAYSEMNLTLHHLKGEKTWFLKHIF